MTLAAAPTRIAESPIDAGRSFGSCELGVPAGGAGGRRGDREADDG
jgi:hypothetical protein